MTRRRRDASTCFMAATKKGTLPNGSMTRKSKTIAEASVIAVLGGQGGCDWAGLTRDNPASPAGILPSPTPANKPFAIESKDAHKKTPGRARGSFVLALWQAPVLVVALTESDAGQFAELLK